MTKPSSMCPLCGGVANEDHTCTGSGDMIQEIASLRALVAELTEQLREARAKLATAEGIIADVKRGAWISDKK